MCIIILQINIKIIVAIYPILVNFELHTSCVLRIYQSTCINNFPFFCYRRLSKSSYGSPTRLLPWFSGMHRICRERRWPSTPGDARDWWCNVLQWEPMTVPFSRNPQATSADLEKQSRLSEKKGIYAQKGFPA